MTSQEFFNNLSKFEKLIYCKAGSEPGCENWEKYHEEAEDLKMKLYMAFCEVHVDV